MFSIRLPGAAHTHTYTHAAMPYPFVQANRCCAYYPERKSHADHIGIYFWHGYEQIEHAQMRHITYQLLIGCEHLVFARMMDPIHTKSLSAIAAALAILAFRSATSSYHRELTNIFVIKPEMNEKWNHRFDHVLVMKRKACATAETRRRGTHENTAHVKSERNTQLSIYNK